MVRMRLTVLGVGSLRCGLPIMASLGNYFGERQLKIVAADPDPERLDLMVRLARTLFTVNKCTHTIYPCTDLSEAFLVCDRAILSVGRHSARKYFKKARLLPRELDEPKVHSQELSAQMDQWVEEFLLEFREPLAQVPEVLSLQRPSVHVPLEHYRRLDNWPEEPNEVERSELPLAIVRLVHSEDSAFETLSRYAKSPLVRWLDQPDSATLVHSL